MIRTVLASPWFPLLQWVAGPYRRPACGAACLGHFEHRRHEYEGTVFPTPLA